MLFLHTIGIGYPCQGVLQLQPRFYQECLHETFAIDGVFECAPCERAVALALMPQLIERADELGPVLGVDAILDRHENRPLIVFYFERYGGRPPVKRGS